MMNQYKKYKLGLLERHSNNTKKNIPTKFSNNKIICISTLAKIWVQKILGENKASFYNVYHTTTKLRNKTPLKNS